MLKKVMIIDDSAVIHQMYRLVMSKYNCAIVDAMNGAEALEILAREPDVDLILLDISMPVMNGIQFLEKLAGTPGRTIPVIVITTVGKEEETVRAFSLGAKAFIQKPFKPADLHALIARINRTEPADGMEPPPAGARPTLHRLG